MLTLVLLTCCLNAPLDVTVDTEALFLGQVVPLAKTDPRFSVPMGYAPAPGLARRISRQEITARIQAAGLPADGLEFPESILVHRRAILLAADQVRQAVLTAFLRQYPNGNVDLISVDVPVAEISTGDITIAASLPQRFDPAQPVFVKVDVRSAGFARTFFARSVVKIETTQPVLRTRISANNEIKPEDVDWKPALLDSTGTVPASMDGLEGMLAKRDLEAGQVLKMDMLYMPLYVRKGETVTVKATAGGVTISATMRAMAAGRLGDTIQVQHLTGAGSTTARVVGLRTLEVLQR
jgi:flagella basal body P-ring formation protein FlgA